MFPVLSYSSNVTLTASKFSIIASPAAYTLIAAVLAPVPCSVPILNILAYGFNTALGWADGTGDEMLLGSDNSIPRTCISPCDQSPVIV